jgi:acyl carrier protein
MYEAGARCFLEVGPHQVLTGLVRECLADRTDVLTISVDRKGKDGIESLLYALANLSAAGYAMNFDVLWEGYAPVADPRAEARPRFTVKLNGANYGRPYPDARARERRMEEHTAAQPIRPSAVVSKRVEEQRSEYIEDLPVSNKTMNGTPVPGVAQAAPQPVEAVGPPAPAASGASLEAYALYQKTLAETHMAYLKTVEESLTQAHQAYLRTMEATFLQMAGQAPSASVPVQRIAAPVAPAPVAPAPVAPAPVVPAPVVAAPVVAAPVVAAPVAPAPVAHVAAAPVAPVAPAPAAVDLNGAMLAIVADKTGYPQDMLSLDMALEADLGIDSIKRVEILSALQEEVPSLPELDPGKMASLATLREIVDFLAKHTGSSHAPAPAPAPAPASAPSMASTTAAPAVNLNGAMLAIVADKTGYPQDMLSLDMALEADLGIDSIKRVEILSALQEEVPSLPELDPGKMASLATLRQICEFLEALQTGGPEGNFVSQTRPELPGLAQTSPTYVLPARYGLELIDAPAVGLSCFTAESVVIVPDSGGVAEALKTLLEARGLHVTLETNVSAGARQVVFLAGLDGADGAARTRELHWRALEAAKTIAHAPLAFITVQDTGGSYGLEAFESHRAWTAGLTGLARTARLEWPEANVKAIDVSTTGLDAHTIASRIAGELLAGGPEVDVAIDPNGTRRILHTIELPAARISTLSVDEHSVIVASGGARGVTAGCLIELAKVARPRFILLGRTALEEEPESLRSLSDEASLKRALLDQLRAQGQAVTPAELSRRVASLLAMREIRATVSALHAAGSPAEYVPVDVNDINDLRKCLARFREMWGPITGVIHAAGVLADKRIADKTREGYERVFETKVGGLEALLDATASDPLRLIGLFSSVAARTGNVGQSDYAMANEVLNKVARAEAARRGESCVVTSMGWGPWAGGMVSPALEAHFKAQGVSLIGLEEGAKAFVAELGTVPGAVEVVLGDGLPTADGGQLRFHVGLQHGQDDYLEGHCIQDTPVLPVVVVLEWFLRAARAFGPGMNLQAIEHLKVLRGIKLDRFRGEGERFTIVATNAATKASTKQDDGADELVLALELLAHEGAVHYSATARLSTKPCARQQAPVTSGLDASPWSVSELYDGLLFHGASFQVIEEVEGVSERASKARLLPVTAMGWDITGWQTDAAVLDGGLQLALIHGALWSGKASLPTSIGEYRDYGFGPGDAPVECVLSLRQVNRHKIVCDLSFLGQQGDVLAQMNGVEMHFRGEPVVRPALGTETAAE